MKIINAVIALALVLGTTGCGDSETDNNTSANNTSANNTSANNTSANSGNNTTPSLSCGSAGYCTSWWTIGTQVDSLPEPTGGEITSGTYVLNDVLARETSWGESHKMLIIDGNSFRNTDDFALGTFSTSGNVVTFNSVESCSYLGESFGPEDDQTNYEYSVDGDTLILFEEDTRLFDGEVIRVGLVFQKLTGDLCEVPGAKTCTIDDCFCAYSLDSSLAEAQCGR